MRSGRKSEVFIKYEAEVSSSVGGGERGVVDFGKLYILTQPLPPFQRKENMKKSMRQQVRKRGGKRRNGKGCEEKGCEQREDTKRNRRGRSGS